MTEELKQQLLKALDEIKDTYDAFYITNKYDEENKTGTHTKQFDLLSKELELPLDRGALAWIKWEYDCYYKKDYENEENTPFGYVRNVIRNGGIRLDNLGKEHLIEKVKKDKENGIFVPNGYATCCVSCKHFRILNDEKGSYYGCAKAKDGRVPCMPPMCQLKERR